MSFCAQALYRIHHIRLLRNNRITQLLGPVEFLAHHCENLRRSHQRFDAVVPILFSNCSLQLISLEILVRLQPAFGLDDVNRVSRSHEHFGQQSVRIERNRRHELVKLLRLQQLRLGCRRPGRLRRRSDWRQKQKRKDQYSDRPQYHLHAPQGRMTLQRTSNVLFSARTLIQIKFGTPD